MSQIYVSTQKKERKKGKWAVLKCVGGNERRRQTEMLVRKERRRKQQINFLAAILRVKETKI